MTAVRPLGSVKPHVDRPVSAKAKSQPSLSPASGNLLGLLDRRLDVGSDTDRIQYIAQQFPNYRCQAILRITQLAGTHTCK